MTGTGKPMGRPAPPFVSRGGEKLDAALSAFGLDVRGLRCADFGANVGGFTDCLLSRGAERVFAVDTGYGALHWPLRKDDRVIVMERTNALYADPPADGLDLVVIDVAFTPQRLIVPAAARWLGDKGRIVSLVKPHYELAKIPGISRRGNPRDILDFRRAADILDSTCRELVEMRFVPAAAMVSPLRGKGGNVEFLLLLGPRRHIISPE